eukprot:TRINITY_DN36972_c0_g2_i1.p1 TRINITY_DN36972_c0_g2~~TRINITY_DN36972_c0_g2_i1.p1  ORF type:complete len:427 (-),score=62.24 TRINITY_DN36972_c0_g2_i1:522-1802(-)
MDLVTKIRWQPAVGFFGRYDEDESWYEEEMDDVVYVDDIDVITEANDIGALLKNARTIAETLMKCFRCAGLRVNFAKGKSELMTTHPKTINAETRALIQQVRTHGVQIGDETTGYRLNVVDRYKRLGMMRDRSGAVMPKLRRRAMAAEVAITSIATLLRSRWLALLTKKKQVKMMVESVLLVGAQCWPMLKESEVDVIRAPYTRACRLCLGIRKQDKVPVALMQTIGFEDITLAIRWRRLVHASKMMRTAPRVLRAAIQAGFMSSQESWLHAVVADLRWLWQQQGAEDLPDPMVDMSCWQQAEENLPGFWCKSLDKLIKSGDAYYSPGIDELVAPFLHNQDDHMCPLCGFEGTKRATEMHMKIRHRLTSWHRSCINMTGKCRVCGQALRCPVRLQSHLAMTIKNKRGTVGCLRQLVVSNAVISKQE